MNLNRRTFLKTAGLGSVSIAAACTSEPDKTLYSLVQAPNDIVTGRAAWYASTCRECPAGCGIIAKNREGRLVKVEGNPLHPINQGSLCIRGQAALLGIYNPDRISTPLLKKKNRWEPISYAQAESILRRKAKEAAGRGQNRVKMITEVVGETMGSLFSESLRKWRSQGPLVFEAYAYESLKAANKAVFGIDGLPAYHMDQADVLVSLGADFLETWLSPVEYGKKFKTMHALNKGKKGLFFHVGPYQSLTGANADRWISCNPGGECAVALGCIRESLGRGRGKRLPEAARSSLERIVSAYDKKRVIQQSGIASSLYDTLLSRLIRA